MKKKEFEIEPMKYRLVEENELRRLIESQMIFNELVACGVDNWTGYDFINFPDINDIEDKLNKYNKFEECDNDD